MIPNFDPETGIHYGVISQHSLNPEALDDIHSEARDLSYEAAVDELKKELRRIAQFPAPDRHAMITGGDLKYVTKGLDLDEMIMVFEDTEYSEDEKVSTAWDLIEQKFNDTYESDGSHSWLYEKDGYVLRDCLHTDIMVIKAPFCTWSKQCSPCVPNAGDLDSPLSEGDGLKSYCLGLDWFDNENKCPYEPYNVGDVKEAS